jgi:CHAT domain-containing protein/tetratricopeptide (TPR) repeat protein
LEAALGPDHPDVAMSLANLAGLYQDRGAHAKAEPLLIRARAIVERTYGAIHPRVAEILNSLGSLYQAQGAYGEAESLYTRALAVREQLLPPTHPQLARSLNNLAALYQQQGRYDQAAPLYERALAIKQNVLGTLHPSVATSLNNLAVLYTVQSAYAKAEALHLRALEIRQQLFGPAHPEVAMSLANLGSLYNEQGAHDKAEALYLRTLDIHERVLGSDHPDFARSLGVLGQLYCEQGDYSRAEPLLRRALDIRQRVLGAAHPEVALSLGELSQLYYEQGAFEKAEPLRLASIAIEEKVLGQDHPELATSLNNLAALYVAQGANAKAETLHLRALDITQRAHGAAHPGVARSLNNLAAFYAKQQAYDKAEPLYQRALEIVVDAFGRKHAHTGATFNNLGELYRSQGAYRKAESFLRRALAILENALGPMHPDVSMVSNNLALLQQSLGNHANAEQLYLRVIRMQETGLGPSHPGLATSLRNFATFHQEQGAPHRAVPLLARAAEIDEHRLRYELSRLSASRKRALMTTMALSTCRVISLSDEMPDSAQALDLAVTTVLRRKSRILDSLVDSQSVLIDHLTPALRETYDLLAQTSRELAAQLYAPFDPQHHVNRVAAVAALRARADDLESILSSASVELRAQYEAVSIAKLQTALPRETALIEFVRYQRYDVRAAQRAGEARYIAYIVLPHGPPRCVALGDAASIDACIDAVLAHVGKETKVDAARAALRRLDTLIFEPIRDLLTGISHVIMSPDSQLNLVPFDALVDAEGRYALERWLVSYVGSGRDLLRMAARRPPRSPATIVAAPDYGCASVTGTEGLGVFHPLPGALAEGQQILELLPGACLRTGNDASKEILAATLGPAVLHIATHAFYARNAAMPAPSSPAPGRDVNADELMASSPARSALEDPGDALDCAGLAMATANVCPDGIVTAREIASYDWWGTQLVVLSACKTGVGEMPSGDGVYGMRRALALAGTEAQIVSLWSVDDASTAVLMRALYTELIGGAGRAQALRRAKLYLMNHAATSHPYYWAAFIVAGDWTPLAEGTMHERAAKPSPLDAKISASSSDP